MSFIVNSSDKTGKRTCCQETQEQQPEVKRTSMEVHTAPHTPNQPIYSNIKRQGRVMIYDDETFAFKMVHDDHLAAVAAAAPGSPGAHSITYHDGQKLLHLNEESFDFKLAKHQLQI